MSRSAVRLDPAVSHSPGVSLPSAPDMHLEDYVFVAELPPVHEVATELTGNVLVFMKRLEPDQKAIKASWKHTDAILKLPDTFWKRQGKSVSPEIRARRYFIQKEFYKKTLTLRTLFHALYYSKRNPKSGQYEKGMWQRYTPADAFYDFYKTTPKKAKAATCAVPPDSSAAVGSVTSYALQRYQWKINLTDQYVRKLYQDLSVLYGESTMIDCEEIADVYKIHRDVIWNRNRVEGLDTSQIATVHQICSRAYNDTHKTLSDKRIRLGRLHE